ncbi:MAG: hypothetical protein V9F04_16965 [Dermatophilaceae bacterium]
MGPNGSVITFTFGTVTNTASTNPLFETFTLTYTAVALNVTQNQTGTQRNNLVTVDWSLAPDGPVTASAPNVRVIEPTIGIAHTVTPNHVDSGDVFTYQIVLRNISSVDAFGVVLTDDLPFNGSGSLILDPNLANVEDWPESGKQQQLHLAGQQPQQLGALDHRALRHALWPARDHAHHHRHRAYLPAPGYHHHQHGAGPLDRPARRREHPAVDIQPRRHRAHRRRRPGRRAE